MGGSMAPRGAWPWLVSVRLHGELMCGGVLVEHSWVLTAAHCFTGYVGTLSCRGGTAGAFLSPPNSLPPTLPGTRTSWHGRWWWVTTSWTSQVWASGQCLSGASCLTPRSVEMDTPLTSLCVPQAPPQHPSVYFQFNPRTFHGDLALLELAVPLAPSPTVSPVCLPRGLVEPSPGTACYIAGWGSLYEGRCYSDTQGIYGASPLVPSAEPRANAPSQSRGMQKRGRCPGMGFPITGALPSRGASG